MDFCSKLLKLQEEIYKNEKERYGYQLYYSPRVSFSKIGDFYEITYSGDGYDDGNRSNFAFLAFIGLLTKYSTCIKSLIFTGADEGANGTKNWDFTRLINSNAVFENLEEFKVKLTDEGEHNQSVIAQDYDEDGQIAKLAAKMPNLKILQVPSAPNEDFFKLKNLKLQKLIVQAGYNTQNFIANLSKTVNLSRLYALDYTDILHDIDNIGTTYGDYKKLFCSDFFETKSEHGQKINFHFTLRENRLTSENLQELNSIKQIQFLHVKTFSGQYVYKR
ncbi:MAG: hypothetical protein LBI78_06135 [Campylobacteraceae bacterium]|jgi:hypothetical protein|nr:hypothetical protein [Campylobacteraceae bacterium]